MLNNCIISSLLRICFLISLLFTTTNLIAQNLVKGKVIDVNSNETLIGTSVIVKGTSDGAITDIDGKFEIKTKANFPLTLVISFIGYKTLEYEVKSNSQKNTVKLETDNVMLKAVEVSDIRISEKQKQAPLTVETMDVIAIKEAASGDFYESLGNLKGVDLTSASLGFKVINTRGFNSTSPVRSLQLIDGIDNQSPGLNFSLGNFLGSSDLDVQKVEIIAGASSAFYGPGAFNGVIKMTTKSPFTFPGLSAQVKVGEQNLKEIGLRWAQKFKNKNGEDKFAYKLNAYYLNADDWIAHNMNAIDESPVGINNPGSYNAVNRYGDDNEFDDGGDSRTFPLLGSFYRTGYLEKDLVDYETENLKLSGSLHYKPTKKTEIILGSSYGGGSTMYQGENRFRLKNIRFFQHKLEFKQEGKFFVRAYATHEDAGDTYDAVFTALKMQNLYLRDGSWEDAYRSYWSGNVVPKLKQMPGFPQQPTSPEELIIYNQQLEIFQANNADALREFHKEARQRADNSGALSYAMPNSVAFDSIFNTVINKNLSEGGSRFYDKSALYHIQGEYKFTPTWATITLGGNGRMYRPDSKGTIFSDGLQYTYGTSPSGQIIKTDSTNRKIENREFGIYLGAEKKFLGENLTLTATFRVDKNENFDAVFSPAISAVYKQNDHTFRFSASSAVRNPTLSDQYLFYRVGPAILMGNITGFDSLVTLSSLKDHLNTRNYDTLNFFNVAPIQPEKAQTIDIGYRGILNKKIFIDANYYVSFYNDFIGYKVGSIFKDDPNTILVDSIQVIRVASNAKDMVLTHGASVGINYYAFDKISLSGNYSWNKLDKLGSDDPLIPAFNTPEHKYNLGVTGRDMTISILSKKLRHIGFGLNYKWIDGYVFEGSPQFTGSIDSYATVDAQINMHFPKIHCTFKLGASNLLDNRVYQVYGGPRVGRLGYFSITYDWKNGKI